MRKTDKIYVAGHTGLVGSAILRNLAIQGYKNIVVKSHKQLALDDFDKAESFFQSQLPDYVFLAAAKVGGIKANVQFGADFITQNLRIQTNVIELCHRYNVKKLLFLGSSCIYPKEAIQPIKEEYLLTGMLEETNLPYAIAKIAGKTMCDAYRQQYSLDAFTVMPSNVYGIGDNFHPENSHLVAGMMRRMHEATIQNSAQVVIWGTGTPQRELIYSEDLADACVHLMNTHDSGGMVNVGSSQEVKISKLANMIKEVVGFNGELIFDHSMPDGTPRKIMDNTKLNSTGWHSKTTLCEGLTEMYDWYTKSIID